jgi:hypothetical protein
VSSAQRRTRDAQIFLASSLAPPYNPFLARTSTRANGYDAMNPTLLHAPATLALCAGGAVASCIAARGGMSTAFAGGIRAQ